MSITTRIALALVAVGILVTLAAAGVATIYGAGHRAGWQARESAPVCWSADGQEDGSIRGCDYRHGEWYIER